MSEWSTVSACQQRKGRKELPNKFIYILLVIALLLQGLQGGSWPLEQDGVRLADGPWM